MSNKILINIIGPTASGKTALSILLAQHFKTEIISSDSRQLYREMTIGTAKPSIKEMQGVPHHFIHHLSIHEPYSAGKYEEEALEKINELHTKNPIVVMVGGSGLYEKAVTEGLDNFPHTPKTVKDEVQNLFENQGTTALQDLLQEKDPDYFAAVDSKNPRRLMRALEVCLASGKAYSHFLKKAEKSRPFKTIRIGISHPREALYERINLRVDEMLARGLIEEAKSLLPYKDLKPLQTVGYQELFDYFEGKIDLETAASEIKKNSRRYAKRQLTWYRRYDSIFWIEAARMNEFKPEALDSLLT